MKKLHDEEKQFQKRNQERKILTKTEGLTPQELYETYRTILMKDDKQGSVLQKPIKLETMLDFLMMYRDLINLNENPLGEVLTL